MLEHKCLKQLNLRFNRSCPSSSLVQSQFNVQLSPCVNRTGHCLENSKQVNRCVDDLSVIRLVQNQNKKNLGVVKNDLHEDVNEKTQFRNLCR